MAWRGLLIVSLLLAGAAALTYVRGERDYRPTQAVEAARTDRITMTGLYAGGRPEGQPDGNTHQEASGFDVNEGKRLYHWFNCVGCHAKGGGDIGPPLMDDKWIYGSEPANIFATIVEGRPNGMPSFRRRIPDAQVWQIVAYVRSMSGLVPTHAAPGRDDDLQGPPPETMAPSTQPGLASPPVRDDRSNTR